MALTLDLTSGSILHYFNLFSFLKGQRTKLDPSFLCMRINSWGCSKRSVKMSWQRRANTPCWGTLKWYWASIPLCTISSPRQNEITSSRVRWIRCSSPVSPEHLYLHYLWTHKTKQIFTSLQIRSLEDCHTPVLNALRKELTKYLFDIIIHKPNKRFRYTSGWRLQGSISDQRETKNFGE